MKAASNHFSESSIVSTPIVSTTNELKRFDEASWGSAAPFRFSKLFINLGTEEGSWRIAR
ncbi:hypothetical protein BOTCAL_0045g00200 [Botryotinia calthae]|uniref:Uncharacterized protein n=1 Tax=Botryotinia calthae TaxID=38488 RepID=A0A4Y8DBI0_9HELO|nr:hypothetical protein BOTCAL_0045g00200 [Botryotinia calthae]